MFETVVYVFGSNAPVVNRNLARLLELVSSPRDKLASSLAWSAKDDGGYGGKKTAANLAAIEQGRCLAWSSFWRQAYKTFAAGQQATGCCHTAKPSAVYAGQQPAGVRVTLWFRWRMSPAVGSVLQWLPGRLPRGRPRRPRGRPALFRSLLCPGRYQGAGTFLFLACALVVTRAPVTLSFFPCASVVTRAAAAGGQGLAGVVSLGMVLFSN
ncbi:hypothetical protein ES703_46156 [subsurface metagenome]